MASHAPVVTTADSATADLRRIFDQQKQAFTMSEPFTLRQRRAQLDKLAAVIAANRESVVKAISDDFGHRAAAETLSAEVMVTLESIRYARRRLAGWMRPRRARTGLLMATTRAATVCQPKGVAGIIAPWNYPFLMVFRPLVYALSAGNRIMVKPSEYSPATSALMQEMMAEHFGEDHIAVVTGEAEVGIAFSQLPFDHLLFTGSTEVGRHVMRAAAENLTPVTLELGGKTPTIICNDVDIDMAAERICFGKMLNSGQTCTAPDYVLCAPSRQDQLVAALGAVKARMFPTIAGNYDYTSIANDRHFRRLQEMLADARDKGATIIPLNPAAEKLDPQHRRMPLTVVRNVTDDMRIANEEIFGPILPIIDSPSLDAAIDYIRARPRPLALNLFADSKADIERVVSQTHAGGMCINDAVMHVAVEDLPFGGTGESGMGRYHGRAGFETFSNLKGVYRRPRWINTAKTLYPPHGKALQRWLHRFFIR
ncbi:MAG: coniferyl aldehyde dehydrogenase [Gammaproteobacteria bacterium]|nr:coniferyl aldehyde dehydrogenase [Gammaproteobacteria bacterium]